MATDRPTVLLLWPGGLFVGGANFGVPQLLTIASSITRGTSARVDVVDLDMERGLGPVDLRKLCAPGYDLVGISCYSSYDYLKVCAIAERVRELLPRAWIVSGGYHASARPQDFTRESAPFDFVVVGDGERPMVRLVEALERGTRPLVTVIGPDAVPHPDALMPYDWSLLERYRPIARKVASQAEIYLSRGCPYDCAFCMERAKRDVSWRAVEPLAAVEEMHRLDGFLDLSRWTLFVADALFGMKRAWRRQFLEALAARPLRARKVWLLIRVDLIEREDLELMARANVSPGFGLESGDPEQLARIRKSGRLDTYLEHMLEVAEWAGELGVPFGANIIVGHPGETEATLRRSARYMEKLFLGSSRGTTGFLSVDPFRLYPGSPIDEERATWEARTGMRVHRYPWWEDGDQDFLSEWVDASDELSYRQTLALQLELFGPIVREIPNRFSYQGPAQDYYRRAIDEQVALFDEKHTLRRLGLWHLWRGILGHEPAAREALARDQQLASAAKSARAQTLAKLPCAASDAVLGALLCVPRERFVEPGDIGASAHDRALPLGDDEGSTISALHAYAMAFDALELAPGDDLVDLGAGTGYGAAVARHLVTDTGSVLCIEMMPELTERARLQLCQFENVTVLRGDAHDVDLWRGASKVVVGFALAELPQTFVEALGPGGRLVAPIGQPRQRLTLVQKTEGGTSTRDLGPVRYVMDRSAPKSDSQSITDGASSACLPSDGNAPK